ncbi:hypothetical protein ACFRU3_35255 [Streptomyces sp. NPDC056910]|uniref:hypothetical protein n=1 Tax=Streptomyces sp. NPDC056910 TaxID=3345964 RepID=UPI00369566FC
MSRLALAAARHRCDVSIPDNGVAVTSSITVIGRTGDAPGGPGRLHVPPGELQFVGSADNANATCTVNACSEVANGTRKLKVQDQAGPGRRLLSSWKLPFL